MDRQVFTLGCAFALCCALTIGLAAWHGAASARDEATKATMEERFFGTFQGVNPKLDAPPIGMVSIRRKGDELEFNLRSAGLSPGSHLVHIHGFAQAEPEQAACPTPEADSNGDGFVDLIETREAAGVTMVPFANDPAALEIASKGYPKADEDGKATYRQNLSFSALESAMQEKFGTPPALGQRVVFIHGVPEDTDLPDTVRSLEGVPAHKTIPIACAEL